MDNLQPSDRLIFPLDVPDARSAETLANKLGEAVGVFKVGLELFVREGPSVLDRIRSAAPKSKLFLDLKFHDIPATVRGAFRSACELGVEFVTVHCDEGERLLATVAEENRGRTRILAVTVLTSLDTNDLTNLGFRSEFQNDPGKLVLLRAGMAQRAGCAGVVCSGIEAARVKKALGNDLIVVTPGIRPAWSVINQDDQKRITTPADAIQNGADYIVVGRPIRDAEDPKAAAEKVGDEIRYALERANH
ncbi:MAG: orotidine-5'-phosphate decarboxylase [Deltaproteobacteria bacterium]|nr:orotidine-5'-phosphate decarboxylase [Deltaproteobacteria bacterium]